jgi:hypothetical protein
MNFLLADLHDILFLNIESTICTLHVTSLCRRPILFFDGPCTWFTLGETKFKWVVNVGYKNT